MADKKKRAFKVKSTIVAFWDTTLVRRVKRPKCIGSGEDGNEFAVLYR
jgi:hypothetical protein